MNEERYKLASRVSALYGVPLSTLAALIGVSRQAIHEYFEIHGLARGESIPANRAWSQKLIKSRLDAANRAHTEYGVPIDLIAELIGVGHVQLAAHLEKAPLAKARGRADVDAETARCIVEACRYMPQALVARIAGVSQATISRIVGKKRLIDKQPEVAEMCAFCENIALPGHGLCADCAWYDR